MHLFIKVLVLFSVVALSTQHQTIADVISTNPSFSVLAGLLKATGLSDILSQPSLYTVFAPNNTAFNALPPDTLKFLLDGAHLSILKSVLLYHVLPGQSLSSYELIYYGNDSLPSAQGSVISLGVSTALPASPFITLSLNDARVIQANIPASNGVIHSIDQVLLTNLWQFTPSYPSIFVVLASDPALSTLFYALESTGLLDLLQKQFNSQYTLFAPTNDAFADPAVATLFNMNNRAILKQILLHHLIGQAVFSTDLYDGLQATTLFSKTVTVRRTQFLGTSTRINDAAVLSTNTRFTNGVVHKISRVLLPFSTLST
jgi:uncharacterized surface protein with fasciclin (FAS1) repeats